MEVINYTLESIWGGKGVGGIERKRTGVEYFMETFFTEQREKLEEIKECQEDLVSAQELRRIYKGMWIACRHWNIWDF